MGRTTGIDGSCPIRVSRYLRIPKLPESNGKPGGWATIQAWSARSSVIMVAANVVPFR
jgi:hypothetical protein